MTDSDEQLLDEDTWAAFAAATAGRTTLPFFDRAIAVTGGDDGAGRLVVDLGCGTGVETRAFLERGWSVFASDGEPRAIDVVTAEVPDEHRSRLTTAVGRFVEVDLPPADLVYAQFSLPFAADEFDESVAGALAAVRPGGWFVGQFLGQHDTWAPDADVAPVDRVDLERLFAGFEMTIDEQEYDGPSGAGPKHWHIFHVEARRPTSR